MTELNKHLIKLIKLHGPLSVSSFMTEALTNPKYGYYVNQNPFGSEGDFITAPEISQMFGELIGLWFADIWLKMNRPPKIHLIELGPGRGTLMADFIRALYVLPDFLDAIELHFVEASEQMAEVQKQKLAKFEGKKNWHQTVNSALTATGTEPVFVIANEFLDALPIRQFQKGELGWHERMVTVDENGDGLAVMLSPFPVQDAQLPEKLKNAELHSVIEVSPMAEYITAQICKHIKKNDGVALFIDYGYTEYQTGETLQAVKNHQYTGVFDEPGYADLSAHVNFRKLSEIIDKSGLGVLGPVTQGKFLRNIGIEDRVTSLSKKATPEQAKTIISSLNRLVASNEMGKLFKVLGIVSSDDIDVVGFEDG